MQSWLEGRNWVGTGAQATGMTASLRILSSKADSNTWESFTRSGLKLESVHQESPRSDVFWNRNNVRSILPGLRRKITGLLLSGPKSSFQIKVNFAFHLEIMLVHCVLSSPKSMQPSTRRFWSTLCFHLLTRFMQMLISFSTCPLCQNHFQVVCWPWYYCAWLASQHAWPKPHMESMGYFQEKDEKQSIQQYRRAEGSIVPQQFHRLIASMPHLTDAGVCAKGAVLYVCIFIYIYIINIHSTHTYIM